MDYFRDKLHTRFVMLNSKHVQILAVELKNVTALLVNGNAFTFTLNQTLIPPKELLDLNWLYSQRGDTLAAIAAVIAARNSCTQGNGGLKIAMSAVCWIPACWKLPVTQGTEGSNHSLQFAWSGWTGRVCSAVAHAQCLYSNWERSRCHSLLWSLLLVYQVHPVSMSVCMNIIAGRNHRSNCC